MRTDIASPLRHQPRLDGVNNMPELPTRNTKFAIDLDDPGVARVLETETFMDQNQMHRSMVIDTRDKMIRMALVALGWTPPSVELTPEEAKRNLAEVGFQKPLYGRRFMGPRRHENRRGVQAHLPILRGMKMPQREGSKLYHAGIAAVNRLLSEVYPSRPGTPLLFALNDEIRDYWRIAMTGVRVGELRSPYQYEVLSRARGIANWMSRRYVGFDGSPEIP